MDKLVKVTRRLGHDKVVNVTIDRPDKRNALNRATVGALDVALANLSADKSVRVVVLTGAGSVFSAGADLEALQKLQAASRASNVEDSRSLANLLTKIARFPKPIIARVNGHAIAGGAGLMAACDFAIVSDGSRFGFTEVRIGFVPAVVMHFVAQRIGGRELRDLLLTGRLIDAAEALKIGLVNDSVPPEELDLVVDRLARELATETSSQAIASTKNLLSRIPLMTLDDAMEEAIMANALARETQDCKDGINAFLSKQSPPWKADASAK